MMFTLDTMVKILMKKCSGLALLKKSATKLPIQKHLNF